jgi:hypothetical protein
LSPDEPEVPLLLAPDEPLVLSPDEPEVPLLLAPDEPLVLSPDEPEVPLLLAPDEPLVLSPDEPEVPLLLAPEEPPPALAEAPLLDWPELPFVESDRPGAPDGPGSGAAEGPAPSGPMSSAEQSTWAQGSGGAAGAETVDATPARTPIVIAADQPTAVLMPFPAHAIDDLFRCAGIGGIHHR